ncbi:MAG: TetR family transcriptional regulator [Frankiales bacterium]|nr:TetR family transcriptional regulator [Frankiales bacterium]
MDSAPTGLRERSKRRRRRAIQLAALRLFTERGYDGTTLADIAEAAEVAPRTVSLYYPSKVELALADANDVAARVSATFHRNPRAEFLDVIGEWLGQEAEITDPELALASDAMFAANPQLRVLSSAAIAEAMRIGSDALFRDVGLASDDPLAPIVAASIGAAIIEYHRAARLGPTSDALPQLLRYLRAMIKAAAGGRRPTAAPTNPLDRITSPRLDR